MRAPNARVAVHCTSRINLPDINRSSIFPFDIIIIFFVMRLLFLAPLFDTGRAALLLARNACKNPPPTQKLLYASALEIKTNKLTSIYLDSI